MQNARGWDSFVIASGRVKAIAWVIAENVVFDGVSGTIEYDPIHGDGGKSVEIGRRDLVSLYEAEVKLDLRVEARIVR